MQTHVPDVKSNLLSGKLCCVEVFFSEIIAIHAKGLRSESDTFIENLAIFWSVTSHAATYLCMWVTAAQC
jgi:hypothetical protein